MKNVVTVTLIAEEELSLTQQLISLYVENRINSIPSAEITLATGSFSEREYPLFDKFKTGGKIEIKLRYEDSNESDVSVFKGVIYQRSAGVNNRQPVLTLLLRDPAIQLCRAMATRLYCDKSDEDVIKAILAEYQDVSLSGSSPASLSAVELDQSVQFQQNDWQHVQQRLQANGLAMLLDNGEITPLDFSETPSQTVDLTIGVDASILDFELSENGRQLYKAVNITYWDQTEPKFDSEEKDFNHGFASDLNCPKASFVAAHITHKEQAKNYVVFFENLQLLTGFEGFIRLTGNADIQPGQGLKLKWFPLKGPDPLLISGVVHEIQNGQWSTTVQLGSLPPLVGGTSDSAGINPNPVGAMWAQVQAWQEDPKKFGRIPVKVPAFGTQVYWAYLGQPCASGDCGFFFPPQEGDQVLLAFIHNNPALGVVLTSVYEQSASMPAPFTGKDDSPTGIVWGDFSFIFNKEDKCMQFKTADANTLLLSQDDGFSVKTQKDLKVETSAGAEIKASQAMNIKGQAINLN